MSPEKYRNLLHWVIRGGDNLNTRKFQGVQKIWFPLQMKESLTNRGKRGVEYSREVKLPNMSIVKLVTTDVLLRTYFFKKYI